MTQQEMEWLAIGFALASRQIKDRMAAATGLVFAEPRSAAVWEAMLVGVDETEQALAKEGVPFPPIIVNANGAERTAIFQVIIERLQHLAKQPRQEPERPLTLADFQLPEPPSQAEFVSRYQDHLIGLLMASFHDASDGPSATRFDYQKIGRAMVGQMKKAETLLAAIHADVSASIEHTNNKVSQVVLKKQSRKIEDRSCLNSPPSLANGKHP